MNSVQATRLPLPTAPMPPTCPCCLPLPVVEGCLVQQVLVLVKVRCCADQQHSKHRQVQQQLAQEAVLLVQQPVARQLVNHKGHEIANHGGTAIQLLRLQQ